MLIAVTGATGFVGSRLVPLLEARGHEVLAFGRRPTAAFSRYRAWDISQGPIDGAEAEAVVHCAGLVTDWGAPAAYEAINVEGTRNVLRSFPQARRFVHVSSASVYDPHAPVRQARESAPYPARYLNEDGRTKMLAECEVRRAERPTIILRPHALYGPGDTSLVPRLLAARGLGWQLAVGNGRNRLSVTHVDNLVLAIERALEGPCASGIFNVADRWPVRLDDLLRTLLDRLGLPSRVLYLPTGVAWPLARGLEVMARRRGAAHAPLLTRYVVHQLAHEYTLDIGAALRDLGYAPVVSYLNGDL
jgi:nucleoside-diphosphate-sugar epimerase